MDFSLSEEQELLQHTVRSFVEKECPPQTVRAIFDGGRQAVPALWKGLAEIGVAGLVVPESHGGAGLELLELALVAEELGRGAVPVPFLGHALATLAIARGGSAAQQAAWLSARRTGGRTRHGGAGRGRGIVAAVRVARGARERPRAGPEAARAGGGRRGSLLRRLAARRGRPP